MMYDNKIKLYTWQHIMINNNYIKETIIATIISPNKNNIPLPILSIEILNDLVPLGMDIILYWILFYFFKFYFIHFP